MKMGKGGSTLTLVDRGSNSPRTQRMGTTLAREEQPLQAMATTHGSLVMNQDEAANSVNQQRKRIEDLLVYGFDLLQIYKDEAQGLRGGIDGLMNSLIERNEGVLKEIHPELINDYKNLK
mmetsp:Transcript_47489/g.34764  ORF Transcript_47489/g.34764 Transcript_47489/m.34764 type:complete len:120 (+) Transcript_47489:350-709(+)